MPELTITHRHAVPDDASRIAPNLRPCDALEINLATGKPLLEVLQESLKVSHESFAIEESGELIALGGIAFVDIPSMCLVAGVPWLVGTEALPKHSKTLVSEGRKTVTRRETMCDLMTNYCHVGNTMHHEWLQRIGFTLMPSPVKRGVSKAHFFQFFRD